MIIKNVTQVGNPIIRRRSKTVSYISPQTRRIIKDLVDSMRGANLVGMAAPQIGKNVRIFVTEIRKTALRRTSELDAVRVFVNPHIISVSKKKVSGYEGCGSVAFAGIFGLVPRSDLVTVKAMNEKGETFILKATGLLARVIQHETDHLDGIIFLDKVTDTKSLMSKEEYLKKK